MAHSTSGYQIEIDRVTKTEWEDLLSLFSDATIYQTWSYGAVRWEEENLSHLVLKKDNQVVGLAQATIRKIPLIKAGIAYIPWGPLWQRKEEVKEVEHLRHLIKALKEEYTSKRGLLLRIRPCYCENHNNDAVHSIFTEADLEINASLARYRTLVLDISPSLAEIRQKLNQKWRNQLNRSEKNGLTVIEGNTDDLYQTFLTLQKEMIERKHYDPGVDYGEFRDIQRDLPDQLKMRIIVCLHNGEPVTATIGSAIGDTGIYLLGATGDKGLQLKGAYLSQWLLIQWMKDRGCRWYDLGGINPEKNPGVYHFKAGLSGREVQHIGHLETSRGRLSHLLVKSLEELRNRRPITERPKGTT
jgi:lipid II:glycine glycyltransferase (peptidoglycan interpeptide bridge formation enzyme)